MGYITATPKKFLQPSFYNLPDGSILSLLIRINHLVIDPFNKNKISVNSVNNVHVFVEKNKRQPQIESSSVLEEDVECITLREEFNVYDLSNGDVMSVKSVVGQVRKLNGYSANGEAIYNVDSQPVIKIKKKSN
jgi:hypothetical protein